MGAAAARVIPGASPPGNSQALESSMTARDLCRAHGLFKYYGHLAYDINIWFRILMQHL